MASSTQEILETLSVGQCDFCEEYNRYLKPLFDKDGDHIMSSCYFGCENDKSIPNERKDDIEILSLNRVEHTPCYGSKWRLEVEINEENQILTLTRLNSETDQNLREKIRRSNNLHDLNRLNQFITHN